MCKGMIARLRHLADQKAGTDLEVGIRYAIATLVQEAEAEAEAECAITQRRIPYGRCATHHWEAAEYESAACPYCIVGLR